MQSFKDEESLCTGAGYDWLPRAFEPAVDGAKNRPLVADLDVALSEGAVLRGGYRAMVSTWGRASVISVALPLLETLGNLPVSCLPQPLADG